MPPQSLEVLQDWLALLPHVFPAGAMPLLSLVAAKADTQQAKQQITTDVHDAFARTHDLYRWPHTSCSREATGGAGT